ncbi:MAG: hypothetical protein FJ098_06520 [Deltaproteobacteria bacterium]|nr:hypothetical protein [Deltaproteobacteria bacterium]
MRPLVLAAVVVGVALSLAAPASALPPKVKGSVRDEETLEAIDIVVRVPKPEAQIFTPKMKTRYENIQYEKSFLKDIMDSVKQGPF